MGSVPSLPESLVKNQELVTDLCRFAEGIATESAVRKKWRLQEEAWALLGENDEFTRAVEEERVRRIRSGAFKRERAQQLVTKAPDVLDSILSDPRANARHRIDSAKALNELSDFVPQRPGVEQDRVIIHIDMGADLRAKGLPSAPGDVLHIEAEPQGRSSMIAESNQFDQQEAIPQKRGPGRPKGSKNKPKTVEQASGSKGVPGFLVD